MLHYNQPIFRRKSKLEIDVSEANLPKSQQDLIDTIAQLEHRLQKALTSIDSYQIERGELIDRILELKLRLQNVVDLLEN